MSKLRLAGVFCVLGVLVLAESAVPEAGGPPVEIKCARIGRVKCCDTACISQFVHTCGTYPLDWPCKHEIVDNPLHGKKIAATPGWDAESDFGSATVTCNYRRFLECAASAASNPPCIHDIVTTPVTCPDAMLPSESENCT